ncbi:MAG: hypothetical protein DRN03_05755, partial [Thermoplasmata archaeon]
GENAYGNTQTITWNIQIPPLGYGNLSGKVTDKETSLAIEGVTMTLVGLEPSNVGTWNTTTDTNGNYSFTNLKKGSYLLTISKDGYNPKTKYIEVTAGQTITQDFQLVPYTEATITYDGEKIVISKGTANLTLINKTLNDPSLLEQLSPKEWLLKVPIQIESTGILYITADDCDWLKLLSMDDGKEAYILNYGILEIKNTKITSWNTISSTPAPQSDSTRAHIVTKGGTTNIYNSNISYLGPGSGWGEHGLAWHNTNNWEVINSTFTQCYACIYGYNVKNAMIKNNYFDRAEPHAGGGHAAAVWIEGANSEYVTIDKNIVHKSNIWIMNSGYHIITNNEIDGGGDTGGIQDVWGAHHNYIAHNHIHHSHPHGAIDVHSATNLVVHDNTIEDNVLHDLGLGVYGTHAIYVHNQGAYNNTVNHNIMWNIQSNAIDITMAHNNTISNNIIGENCGPLAVQSGHGNIVDGNKVYRIAVTAEGFRWDTYDNILISNDAQEYYSEDLNGAFSNTIRNPKGDSFKVIITDANAKFILEFTDGRTFKLNGDAGGHTNVTLTGPGTYTIDVEGVAATGNISGNVTDTSSNPIENATIIVEGTGKSGKTDANGNYEITHIPAGTYTITASANGYDGQSKTVEVKAGETITVNFQLNVETTPPTIINHSPEGTNVPVSTIITVTFSEAMNKTSAEGSFSISPSVSGSFSWDGNKMIFTPDSELEYETTYNVIISEEAKDLAGNNLESAHSWNFTTTSKPDVPEWWGYYLGAGEGVWGRTSSEAHTGNYSAFLKGVAYEGGNWINIGLIAGKSDGYSGADAYTAIPNTTYNLSFWMKGDFKRISVYALTWNTENGSSSGRKWVSTSLGWINPTNTWTKYEGTFTTPADAKKFVVMFRAYGNSTEENLGTIYVDDVNVNIGEGNIIKNPSAEYPISPSIISFSPENTTPTQYVNRTYTFSVTVSQPVSNAWFLDGEDQHNNAQSWTHT